MNNKYVIAFLFWPAVVLVCALLNMLITWTFSWSELIFDYFIGVAAGWFLFTGTEANPHPASTFFFIFSHGLFATLWWAADSFRHEFSKPETFFWFMAGIRIGAVVWCALWDHISVKLGAKLSPGPFFFSFVLFPVKASFAWFTSAVGFLIWLAGMFWALGSNTKKRRDEGKTIGKAGFAGGVFWDEFAPGSGDPPATTLGCTVHTWSEDTPFEHELYHTRQYVFMGDWLIPFWCVGLLWALISTALSKEKVSYQLTVGAHKSSEIGNPIEVAAYHI